MKSHIVIGLGYGDEGKGSWVDHLVRRYGIRFMVRFNGGAQAAHHVVTQDGRVHCFQQFGSGSFVPGTSTILSRFMLIEPQSLFQENEKLEKLGVNEALSRMFVSENAPIITPFNRLLNRIMESYRAGSRHGSCGYGIGITQRDVETLRDAALYVRDLGSSRIKEKLLSLQELRLKEAKAFESPQTLEDLKTLAGVDLDFYIRLYRQFYSQVQVCSDERLSEIIRDNSVVFEGAQGVLLDQDYGFFPHVTRSRCTLQNAEMLLKEAGFSGEVSRVGLLRGYGTRHGAGPFVTEADNLPIPACHNGQNLWQGNFRLGWFDVPAARYALEVVGGLDVLAITNLDRMLGLPEIKIATRYKGTDDRFFSGDGKLIYVQKEINLELLAERTRTMQNLQPAYLSIPGWSNAGSRGIERYLNTLEKELVHRISAYSDTADDRKVYRTFIPKDKEAPLARVG